MIWDDKKGILIGQKVYVKGDTIPDSVFKNLPEGTKEGLIKSGKLIESPKAESKQLEEKPKDEELKVDVKKKKKVKKNA